jgi:hypothetical protein
VNIITRLKQGFASMLGILMVIFSLILPGSVFASASDSYTEYDFGNSFSVNNYEILGTGHVDKIEIYASDHVTKLVTGSYGGNLTANTSTTYDWLASGNSNTYYQSQYVRIFYDSSIATSITRVDRLQGPTNQVSSSTTVTTTYTPPPDTTPPAVPSGLTGTSGNTQVSLSWTAVADPDLSGYFVWKDGVKVNATKMTGTSYTVTGLTNGVNYSFQVSSVDANGNESNRSTSLSLQPIPPPDTTPPDAPTNLTGVAGDKQATLSWTSATATDKSGYNVYRNGIKQNLTLISATTYLQTGLSNGTAYTYTVKTVDTSGNESAAASNSVVVTPVLAPVPLGMTLSANGTSIIVSVTGGKMPYDVNWGTAQTDTFSATSHYIMGTTKATNYTVTLTDANGATVTKTVNTGTFSAPLAPIMPDSTSLFQSMINSFGKAGTIALIVIGGAVALGLIVILALWAWRLTKKWLASSK